MRVYNLAYRVLWSFWVWPAADGYRLRSNIKGVDFFIAIILSHILMCVIPVVRINYLKESNSQNTTCLEIDGIFYN
jgi:hypothetical protein